MPTPCRSAIVLLIQLLALAPVASHAAGQDDPAPQFDPGNADLASLVDPDRDVFIEGESFTGGPPGFAPVTSEFLRMTLSGGQALMLRGSGQAAAQAQVPAEGTYTLWVRSHGATGRQFSVQVGTETSGTLFGDATMNWRAGGTFELSKGTVTVRVLETRNNPYFDALILSDDPEFAPDDLVDLWASGGDERWASVNSTVGFSGGPTTGRWIQWTWDLGDGTQAEGNTVRHRYQAPGDYQVTLTRKDGRGAEQSRSQACHIVPAGDYVVWELPIARSGAPRFGDINGDGQADVLVGRAFEYVDAYLHDGTVLWSYESPPEFPIPEERREHPMVIWDFDGDGMGEVAMWRFIDGKQWLCLCDGMTGEIEKRVPWPAEEGFVNGRLAVGNLTGKPDGSSILMLNGHYTMPQPQYADAFDVNLNHLLNYRRDGADRLGHFIYSADVTGDAREEVFASAVMIRPDGEIGWERKDLWSDHADSIRLGDINGDGKIEVAYSYSGRGVYVLDATTGETLWHHPTNHAQQLEIADVRPDVPGIEVIVGDRFYLPDLRAKLLIYDCHGKLLTSFPQALIKGNPNLGVLQWDGEQGMEIAWHNMVLDGRCQVLAALGATLHHAFDFHGDGKEEFVRITRDANGQLHVTAYGDKSGAPLPRVQDYETRRKAANHSHY